MLVYKNKKGLAMFEALIVIWVMFVLLGATLGVWGICHTAVLHSISARNYSFFLFNNRSDLSYLRDFYDYNVLSLDLNRKYYGEYNSNQGLGFRYTFIQAENVPNTANMTATLRRLDFRNLSYDSTTDLISDPDHTRIHSVVTEPRNKKQVKKAWIMIGYGICLSSSCGDR